MTTRAQIVAEARTWLGTPYQHQGRLKGVACDCPAPLIGIGRLFGMVAPDFDVTNYSRSPDGWSLEAHCDQWMTRIPRERMAPGDAILLRWGGDPQHLGIVGDYVHGGLSIIHAFCDANGGGKVIETCLNPVAYAHRFVAAYRLPGVEEAAP